MTHRVGLGPPFFDAAIDRTKQRWAKAHPMNSTHEALATIASSF
jgi:hypothetical protein